MTNNTSKNYRILLVGHCGPDSTYLKITIKAALGAATILSADDGNTLNRALEAGVDLALLNRELGYGLMPDTGVEMIRELRSRFPQLKMMLVSNYPEAQAAAVAAGAAPGFGKREMGSPRMKQVLRDAVAAVATESVTSA